MASNLSTNFNVSQFKAVNHFKGPALVLAGPGSGKTLVIVHRIKNLIEAHNIPPEQILVVTFSKAAAEEMRERFEKLDLKIHSHPTFGTFHSIFFSFLKAAYGYDSSNIIRESQKYEILKYEVEKYDLEYDDEAAFLKKISSEISRAKNSLIPLGKFMSSALPPEIFRTIYRNYNQILLNRKLIDFDDMLSMTHNLFKERPDILSIWQDTYRFILVDEFQDINRIQYEAIKLLAGKSKNLFVVGDDDQSIYGFRGSRPGIMFSFQKDFPEAERILLNINYRSRKLILSKSQQLISKNTDRLEKKVSAFKENSLSTDSHTFTTGEIFSIRAFDSQAEQYNTIVQEIYDMKRSGHDLSEIAILFRNNFDSSVMAEKLAERNIPFTIREIPKNIFKHFIALDLLAYIRTGMEISGQSLPAKKNSQDRSMDISAIRADFLRIINRPLRYISREAINDGSLKGVLNCQGSNPYASQKNYDGRNSFSVSHIGNQFSADAYISSMKRYYSTKPYMLAQINILEKHLQFIGTLTPFAAIEYIRKAVGYEDYLKTFSKEKHADLNELFATLDAIEESARLHQNFIGWNEYIEKYSDDLLEAGKEKPNEKSSPGSVQLMTMHSSKGLEFDTVYIPNVNHETIPIRKAVSKEEVSEERRLFYVAMTRARDHLKISYVNHVRNRKIAPSEFLENIL